MEDIKEAGQAYAFFNHYYMNGGLLDMMKLAGKRVNANGIKLIPLTKNQLPPGLSQAARKKPVFGRFPEVYSGKLFHQQDKPVDASRLVYIVKAESPDTENWKVASRLGKILEEMCRKNRRMPKPSYRIVLYKDCDGNFVYL